MKKMKLHSVILLLAIVCLWLPSTIQAAPGGLHPPPDGGYPGGNTAEGDNALFNLTTGTDNTAIGFSALYNNTTTNHNTAVGSQALYNNTSGPGPINGVPGGEQNTAVGYQALFSNTTGSLNTANGAAALPNNTTGFFNTATGHAALANNTTGFRNTADGKGALVLNTTGGFNVATGNAALFNNTTGSKNIALGFFAGDNLTTGDNNIDIANIGVAAEANTIRIGTEVTVTDQVGIVHPAHTATFIAGIFGAATAGGIPVYVDANGQLGTIPSSRRFKDEIKPMEKTSEAILSLRPVTFRYKKEIDPKNAPQFGLVAEEVAKVNPDLVTRGVDGKVYTVRYEAVNAMLLNEFLKEHKRVEELQMARVGEQKEIAWLKQQLKDQAALIQKVSDKIEISKARPQVVANDR